MKRFTRHIQQLERPQTIWFSAGVLALIVAASLAVYKSLGGPQLGAEQESIAYYVNAGDCGATTWQGITWQADQYYEPGRGWGYVGDYHTGSSSVGTIANVSEDGQDLFRCRSWGPDIGYYFDVPAGEYTVKLYFAEPLNNPGERKFDILLEGQLVADNFDIAAEAGGISIGIERSFTTTVTDGHLNVNFAGGQDGASDVNALVQAVAVEGSFTPPPPAPTEAPPTEIPPTEVPPTSVPPTEVPPTDVPPTEVPPTETVPAEVPPTGIPPTEEPVEEPTAEPTKDVPGGDVQPPYPQAADGLYAQYVNVGACGPVEWQGVTWEDDQPYAPGGWGFFGSDYTARAAGSVNVVDQAGTPLGANGQTLHNCRSFGTDFGYRFDVPDGRYTVELRFVEPQYDGPGGRSFDVSIQGQKVLDNFDIAVEAGGRGVAIARTFILPVTGGRLEVEFDAGEGAADVKAMVQAIAVYGEVGGEQPAEPTPAPTEEPTQAPTEVPPTEVPPTDVPPTSAPPTATPAPTQEPTPEPSPQPAPGSVALYVNAGECGPVEWQGATWQADQPYAPGGWGHFGGDYTGRAPGESMVSDPSGARYDDNGQYLHRCRAFGSDFGYRFDLPNDSYQVELRFVEPVYDGVLRDRAFDVTVEGQTVLDNYRILDDAGGKGVVAVRRYLVPVVDGELEIRFSAGEGAFDTKAVVQAISVVSDDGTGGSPTPPEDDGSERERPVITHNTANGSSITAAKEVLSYLYGLTNRPDGRVVAGQFGSYGDGATVGTATNQINRIYEQTGKWPALTGMDYRNWDMQHGNNLSDANRYLIDFWNSGGLVTVSWHAANPWTGGSSTDMNITQLSDLITPGRPGYDQWIRMLDDIASGLQELEDNGVVVIWRPMHEMNGGWFWWWGNEDKEGYKALWRHMYNYFTYQKGLDNLLWAWSPNFAYDQWKADLMEYYPGDAYVDIVGMDKYRALNEADLDLNGWGTYDKLVATGKPVALLEFGPSPASAYPNRPDWDYTQLIHTIRERYPRIVLFQAWEWHWQIPENPGADGLMNDPWIVDREELPLWSR